MNTKLKHIFRRQTSRLSKKCPGDFRREITFRSASWRFLSRNVTNFFAIERKIALECRFNSNRTVSFQLRNNLATLPTPEYLTENANITMHLVNSIFFSLW